MVLGLSSKNRKEASVNIDYQIHVQEIKPWPPSQSLRSLRSVMIQWQHGDRSSGSTKAVVPSLGSVVGEGKIEFNESFRLSVTLLRDMNVKNKDADTFHKNFLEFNLYEPRRDKTQLLATSTIDLADYGIVKETISVNAPMNSKRSFRNTAQPVLFVRIQPVEKAVSRTSSSLKHGLSKEASLDKNGGGLSKEASLDKNGGGLSKEASLDKNGGESVSALMNEEYAEEAEIASFTDDDVSSHSSVTAPPPVDSNNGFSPPNQEITSVSLSDRAENSGKKPSLSPKLHLEKSNTLKECSSPLSLMDMSSEFEGPENGHASASNSPISSSSVVSKKGVAHVGHSSLSSFNNENAEKEDSTYLRGNDHGYLGDQRKLLNRNSALNGDTEQNSDKVACNHFSVKQASSIDKELLVEKTGSKTSRDTQVNREHDENGKTMETGKVPLEEAANSDDDNSNSFVEDIERKEQDDNVLERETFEEKWHSAGDEPSYCYSQDATRNQASLGSDSSSPSREDFGNLGMKGNILKNDRLKHVKSVRSSPDTARSNGHNNEVKEHGLLGDAQNSTGNFRSNERKDTKVYLKDTRSAVDSKIQQLEHKVKMLEAELREAAAVEAALYSVVAEHGSSMSKVHAPARRLSRLYLHSCKDSSKLRRASAARSAVSGLVLVAKACGNDVPRLTFWLSNAIVLRAIITQANGGLERPFSASQSIEKSSGQRESNKISTPLRWKESSPSKKENRNVMHGSFGEWEDLHTLQSALEKAEAWIFSRIVESVWWQTLTPHMQSAAEKVMDRDISSGSGKSFRRISSSGDQDQVNFSLDHWKKAFKDACERLCPVRAGGHECGCLPLLARLIMEQCVARLDVAMFNAILRESADEIPTDPVSDPISDLKVLPVPAGKSSFGAGAQLKNAIGNWSRWLSDLFGMDDDDAFEDENDHNGDDRQDLSFKSFNLLNALSDLMMLPKDMLLSKSIRKEVCPTFGPQLIKRVLDNFVPDEFCPDPIPDVVLEALDSEDSFDDGEKSITNFPFIAAPPLYVPPSAAVVSSIIGEVRSQTQLKRSGSSVLRKSYTSDDELDELNSPLSSIFIDCSNSSVPTKPGGISKGNSNRTAVRYELLRDIWMNSE